MSGTLRSIIPSSGGGGGAPVDASYLTLSTDATLTNERVLTAGTNITFTDNGAGNTLVINASGGGGGSPGGGDGEIQYNNAGAFGGIALNVARYNGTSLFISDVALKIYEAADETTNFSFDAVNIPPTTTVILAVPSVSGTIALLGNNVSEFFNDAGYLASVPDGDYGDVIVLGSGTSWVIDNEVVTYAKIQNVTANRLLGRPDGDGGVVQEIICTAAGRALIDDANATAQRTTLGLGTAATSNTGDFAATSHTHAAGDVTSGTFADARIAASNVTQHQAALSIASTQVTGSKTSAYISDFGGAVEDKIGTKIIAGVNITVSYNGLTGNTTITSTGGNGWGSNLALLYGAVSSF